MRGNNVGKPSRGEKRSLEIKMDICSLSDGFLRFENGAQQTWGKFELRSGKTQKKSRGQTYCIIVYIIIISYVLLY